ncbi:hypothetical protein [Paenibacillus etheri]|uniref:Uncharacterized protein n=1 Tax=Paenibacillus etheri TaxID=1306852 RepID=A0A0W1B5A2_9BACL|nr:hypothetical protein [Paenibacillus etheri]KTD88647.1 hypothetical protein UQ64_04855 [Paenibacillus etheri]
MILVNELVQAGFGSLYTKTISKDRRYIVCKIETTTVDCYPATVIFLLIKMGKSISKVKKSFTEDLTVMVNIKLVWIIE